MPVGGKVVAIQFQELRTIHHGWYCRVCSVRMDLEGLWQIETPDKMAYFAAEIDCCRDVSAWGNRTRGVRQKAASSMG